MIDQLNHILALARSAWGHTQIITPAQDMALGAVVARDGALALNGAPVYGVALHPVAAGEPLLIQLDGIVTCVAGGRVAPGDWVAAATDGRVATAGRAWLMGVALDYAFAPAHPLRVRVGG